MIASLLLALAPKDAPSVIVVILDDVAAADISVYGGPVETPYLEKLAAEGLTFTRAYAHAWCAPTRRSIAFGEWAAGTNGTPCSDFPSGNVPSAGLTSLAEALPNHASAWLGKWHNGGIPGGGDFEEAPVFHGFDYWVTGLPANLVQPACAPSSPSYTNWRRFDASASGFTATVSTGYHGTVLRDAFINGWGGAPKPALGVLAPQLAHAPLHVPPAALLPQGYPTPTTDREHYEAMIVALDKIVGQMLAHVDLDETLVFVVGDNGTPEDVAPEPSKAKNSVYERGVRVPLIVAGGPVANGGRVSAALVHAVDIYATAIEACGGSPSGDGHSFLAVLEDTLYIPRTHVFLGERWDEVGAERGAVSIAGFKLRQVDADGDGDVDDEELYDLTNDPGEATDVLAQNSAVADAIRTWLEAAAP